MASSSYIGEEYADHVAVPACIRHDEELCWHYAELAAEIFFRGTMPQYDDAAYWRYSASCYLPENQPQYRNSMPPPPPSEDDAFDMTYDDCIEEAEKIECGFVGGEEMV
jgi:hypothetical protein